MSTTTAAAAAKITSTTAVGISVVLSGCVIANAFRQKKQFYPSVVYICKSNPSMAVSSALIIFNYFIFIQNLYQFSIKRKLNIILFIIN